MHGKVKNMRKNEIIIKLIGFILIVLAFLFNPLSIKKFILTNFNFSFNNIFYVLLIIGELFLIFAGIYLIKKPRKIIKIIPSIFLSLITILIFIIITNFILNIIRPNDIMGINSVEFHHMYKANDSGYRNPSSIDEFERIKIETNELGMRGNSIPTDKKEIRILILGDSFIEAQAIQYEKTVGQILQSKLGNKEYLVMQQGYSSWSPLLELNFLIKTFDKLKPDHVFLVLFINDFSDADVYSRSDSGYTKEAIFDAQGYPIKFNIGKNEKPISIISNSNLMKSLIVLFNKKRSCKEIITQQDVDYLLNLKSNYTVSHATTRLNNLTILENSIRLGRPYQEWDEETMKTVSLSFKYINKMNEFLKEKNTSLTIMLTPIGWNIAPDENILGKKSSYYCLNEDVIIPDKGIRDKIKIFSLKQNINYIELIDPIKNFKKNNPDIKLFLRSDGHWNENAHNLISDVLYNEIE